MGRFAFWMKQVRIRIEALLAVHRRSFWRTYLPTSLSPDVEETDGIQVIGRALHDLCG